MRTMGESDDGSSANKAGRRGYGDDHHVDTRSHFQEGVCGGFHTFRRCNSGRLLLNRDEPLVSSSPSSCGCSWNRRRGFCATQAAIGAGTA